MNEWEKKEGKTGLSRRAKWGGGSEIEGEECNRRKARQTLKLPDFQLPISTSD